MRKLLCFSLLLVFFVGQATGHTFALSEKQKRIYSSEIYYFDLVGSCGSVTAAAPVPNAGAGKPEGTTFPKLDPGAMATAIDKYIKDTNANSKMKGLGATIVASAEKADINPFLIVTIAEKESGLSSPDDFNVKNGNNSFGRTALDSQPHFVGSRTWYKWTSVKASVDYTAPENKDASGGGDIMAYLRKQYGSKLDTGDLTAFMNEYAPPGDGNDTPGYIANVKKGMAKMIELTNAAGGPAAASGASAKAAPASPAAGGATAADAVPAGGGALYMLGDSITVRSKDLLEEGFKAKGYTPYINASGSRSIKNPGVTAGFKTSGYDAVADDKSRIDNANTVVIALGTNTEPNFEDAIKDLITRVKSYDTDNSGLKIYWVNVFSKGGGSGYDKIDAAKINESINRMAATLSFSVIDTTAANIPLDDTVHPTIPEGTKKFSNLVVSGVASTASNAPAEAGSSCSCGVAASPDAQLVGKNNVEKALNFFISQGFSAEQAAGIIGNFMQESGENMDPTIVEGGGHSDTVPPPVGPDGQPGYGIAQWTSPGRKQALAEFGKDKVNTLSVQLNFVMKEMETSFPSLKGDISKIKDGDVVEQSAFLFHKVFEVSNDSLAGIQERVKSGKSALASFGSGNAGATAGAVACTTKTETGEVSGEYSLPVPKRWYTSNPEYFTGPHHGDPNDPAVDIPVPRGTPVYSITDGKIIAAPNEGGYGLGVTIEASNGVQYVYGHGTDGGSVSQAKQGDMVKAGQLIMHVNDTGSSRGDHLHISILVAGKEVCPQKFLVGIATNKPIDPKTLPSTGCTS